MEDNNFLFYIFPFDSCSPCLSCQGSLECTTTSVLNYIIISFTATIHPSIHLTKSPVIGTLAHDMRNILKNTSVYYYHPFQASWMVWCGPGCVYPLSDLCFNFHFYSFPYTFSCPSFLSSFSHTMGTIIGPRY